MGIFFDVMDEGGRILQRFSTDHARMRSIVHSEAERYARDYRVSHGGLGVEVVEGQTAYGYYVLDHHGKVISTFRTSNPEIMSVVESETIKFVSGRGILEGISIVRI